MNKLLKDCYTLKLMDFFFLRCLMIAYALQVAFPKEACAEQEVRSAFSNDGELNSLEAYRASPLILNRKSIKILHGYGLVSDGQMDSFCRYMRDPIDEDVMEELIFLPFWDEETVAGIAPYVKAPAPVTKEKVKKRKRQGGKKRATKMVEEGWGSQLHKFSWEPRREGGKKDDLGAPCVLQMGSTLQKKGHYDLGFLSYKGMGEPLGKSYTRFYGVLEEKELPAPVRRIVFGKYFVKLGHGLVIKEGMRKGELGVHFAEQRQFLKPCKGKERNEGLSGIGVHLAQKKLDAVFFLAYNQRYAKIWSEAPKGEFVKSLPSSNTLYRSEKDWEIKRGLEEKVAGGALLYQITPMTKLGLQVLGHTYSYPLEKLGIVGKNHGNMSLWGERRGQKHQTTGEIACSKNGGIGLFLGHRIKWPKRCIMVGLEHCSPTFYSIYGIDAPKNKGAGEQAFSMAGEHAVGGANLLHTLKLTRPVVSSDSKKGYSIHYGLNPTYKFSKSLELTGKLQLKYFQHQPSGATCKITSKYTYEGLKLNTTFCVSSKNVAGPRGDVSLGACQNISYTWGSLTAKLHGSLFHAPKTPLYFHTPDIKAPSLHPPTKGSGVRFGSILEYNIQDWLSLQLQAYWPHDKEVGFSVQNAKIKFQLSYNA